MLHNRLEIGNIVHLISGSPNLRVVGFTNAIVEWENEQGEIEQRIYPEVCLKRIES